MAEHGPDLDPVDALVVSVADELEQHLADLTTQLRHRMTDEISDLPGDPRYQGLLGASIESNLETFAATLRFGMAYADVTSPPPAAEYARRLAQRGTNPSALLRAYRLGQESALLWSLDRIGALESDRAAALLAGRRLVQAAFRYVDAVSAKVLHEYETERVTWLSTISSVRRATMTQLLAGPVDDVGAAEAALGYWLRQHHVAAVLWLDHEGSPDDLRSLEDLLAALGRDLGARGPVLFVPQDRSTGWGWLPFGHRPPRSSGAGRDTLAQLASIGAKAALGGSAAGVDGFRATHHEALRAQELAEISGTTTRSLISWSDADVRAATLLMHDLDATRRRVADALGGMAVDDESAARLRETVRTFVAKAGSYADTAPLLHVHKNTVRYRIERAVEARGRSLDIDRLDLELALIACEWFGSRVLSAPTATHPVLG